MILLQAALISMLPIAELRGGIPWAIANGVNPLTAFIVCVIANFLVAPIGYLFLSFLHKEFLKWRPYEKLFTYKVEKARKSFERHVGTKWEMVMLLLLVGIPLPMTGAYTGTLLAWFFELEKKKAFLAIGGGVILAGIIVTALTLGIVELF
tara:strand:+ start:1561 stop:2013 length:453 start_codon:yes stop_codon:yes gene_type:complete